jgi:hypothetical protein
MLDRNGRVVLGRFGKYAGRMGNSQDRRHERRERMRVFKEWVTSFGSGSDKKAKIFFLVGSCLALVIWGFGLIGVSVNIWLGGLVLAVAFTLGVWALWIWEGFSKSHILLRLGTVTVAAVAYFAVIGNQIMSELHHHDHRAEASLQIEPPDILQQNSVLSPNQQWGGNIHSLNPGPSRAFEAYGYSNVYIETLDGRSDERVLAAFEKEVSPIRQAYAARRLRGPEVGVGHGIWATALTPPLTQQQIDGLFRGTITFYFVSWVAWRDLKGQADSAFDCRWLQQLPKRVYRRSDIVWHFCVKKSAATPP